LRGHDLGGAVAQVDAHASQIVQWNMRLLEGAMGVFLNFAGGAGVVGIHA
jgi:hypothetical protein